MIIDGKKLACATCIKGHRASHCKHKERPLIEIKKKGRPATQCKRCRELRTKRQLHVKCDCNDDNNNLDSAPRKKRPILSSDKAMKEKLNLRLIAPKPEQQSSESLPPQQPSSPYQLSPRLPSPQQQQEQQKEKLLLPPISQQQQQQQQKEPLPNSPPGISSCGSSSSSNSSSGCCSSNNSMKPNETNKKNNNNGGGGGCLTKSTTTTITTSCNSNNSNNASVGCGCGIKEIENNDTNSSSLEKTTTFSGCGSNKKNDNDKTTTNNSRIRVITCRCGDSCACPGCDAHPSRVMKGQNDPYTGFTIEDSRRRLSIAAICSPADTRSEQQPTAILNENGVELCGCGCSQTLESCSDCFRELCQNYYSTVSSTS